MQYKKKNRFFNTFTEPADPIDIHIGKRLRIKRKSAGLSQTRLGEMLGVTYQQIQKYERADNRISASCLFRLAFLLDVPVEWFFAMEPIGVLKSDGQTTPNIHVNRHMNILYQDEIFEVVRIHYQNAYYKYRRKSYDLSFSGNEKIQ
jgi:transcriptional regulator with XRE-family HTH domain